MLLTIGLQNSVATYCIESTSQADLAPGEQEQPMVTLICNRHLKQKGRWGTSLSLNSVMLLD